MFKPLGFYASKVADAVDAAQRRNRSIRCEGTPAARLREQGKPQGRCLPANSAALWAAAPIELMDCPGGCASGSPARAPARARNGAAFWIGRRRGLGPPPACFSEPRSNLPRTELKTTPRRKWVTNRRGVSARAPNRAAKGALGGNHAASPSTRGQRSGRRSLFETAPLVARSMPAASLAPTRPLCLASLMEGCVTPAAAASLASEPSCSMAVFISSLIPDMRHHYRRSYRMSIGAI